jgi:HMG (high mobility group) box
MPVRAKGKPRRSHGKIGFADMARAIAFKWKQITPHDKAVFQRLAAADKKRYTEEMKEWKLRNTEGSEKNEATSIKQWLQSGAEDEETTVLNKKKDSPEVDEPVPSLPSLTLEGVVMSLSSRLSVAQQQFASAESALLPAQHMHTHCLQLMQLLGFEALSYHRAMLDMAINQSQIPPLCIRDSAETNAAYQSFLHDYTKQQQQQLESMYGTLLPSTAGPALPMAMLQGSSLCRNNPSVSGAARMQHPTTMASMNQQPMAHSSSSSKAGGGDGTSSMAHLAHDIGPECCKFLIDIFLQD